MKNPRMVRIMLTAFAMLALIGCTKEPAAQAAAEQADPSPAAAEFVVYKDPQCGCCNKWIEHMKNSGFVLAGKDTADLSGIKREFDLKAEQQSCHTAVWRSGETRYVFEGHVPASLVQRFLDAPPENARGLLVPGMPVGSPGMEYGDQRMPYDVLLLRHDGTTEVYAHVE